MPCGQDAVRQRIKIFRGGDSVSSPRFLYCLQTDRRAAIVGKHRDWTEIEKDYQENGLSLKELAVKYDVSISTLKKAAMRQGWGKGRVAPKRRQTADRVKAALTEVEEMEPNGTDEMEPEQMEPNGTKVVPLWPDDQTVLPAESGAERFQRIVDEMLDRVEDAICQVDTSNAGAVKLLTAALKDLRSLKGLDKSPLDLEEQKARIEKLRSETRIVEDTGEYGVILLPEIERVVPPE